MQTVILDSNPINCKTTIIDEPSTVNKSNRIQEKNYLELVSNIDQKLRKVFIGSKINQGAYNDIFTFGKSNRSNIDDKIVIRISNNKSTDTSKESEKKGAKIQYKLCSLCKNIGNIVDYGKIYSRNEDYYIIEKYGVSLKDVLESKPKYTNFRVVLTFMKEFLYTMHCIHTNNFSHLDIKPSNILLKHKLSLDGRPLDNLDFALIDFGGAKYFRSNNSRKIDGQMASPAFSPPEVIKGKFGKKSDTWAYGIVCYLVCIGKFFFDADAHLIFMGDNKKELRGKIEKAMDKLVNSVVPKNKSIVYIKEYFKPLSIDNLSLLKDFFLKVFEPDIKKRPRCTELMKHPIFKHI